ncbi:tyrosine-type recombinase/integrase [Paenibacillus macquariensis]|uniref:Site-specific recombinase XerD n=1 Tax=Paenibacillus macquariensis TaxID=948756 RepID=A0ABY1JKD1_9BACL|nr:tyrosine-type recombinase/integrase [Paenibacillus macquariensis]MEC0089901.1 tyrosine-type recombinase/integrase [Paenibacillus macquariensis]OAB30639.1 transposase [Paenibacillus macquariensis subsp. macquariensis]SIQ33932.1 Site-specific recombinase XerD [Paenibacillus macquariensis]
MITFESYLIEEEKSINTIKSYMLNVSGFMKWFDESKGTEFKKLHRENIKDYISYLKVIKKLSPSSINAKISALIKYNDFLISTGLQTEQAITKRDMIKVQRQYASLATVGIADVEKFRQLVLESKSKRNYAIVSLLGYGGLRISEALNIRMDDFNTTSREVIVSEGKGKKTRTVIMNSKVKVALLSWIKERTDKGIQSDYLFPSSRGNKLDRTVINKLFNKYSSIIGKDITPHDLRHFFCTYALENNMSVHEVANQAGHSNIHTTMMYTNPSKQKMIDKMDRL